MQLIRGLQNLHHYTGPSIVTIGAFDGLHAGHQAVLQQLKESPYKSVVILFEPLPKEYFAKQPIKRLSRLRDKLHYLKASGIDAVLCIRFNERFSQMTAQQFIDVVLLQGLNTEHLIVGDDFRFGFKRQGDFTLLQQQGFRCESTNTYLIDDQRVSSSRVRNAVIAGEFSEAKKLLNRSYALSGKVQHGDKNGRKWGFPTLNIGLSHEMAVSGVYAVRVNGLADGPLNGVANVGVRPTVSQGLRRFLEVHLLDFDGDCYGREIVVDFIEKIRDEVRFASLDELKAQISLDVDRAKVIFQS